MTICAEQNDRTLTLRLAGRLDLTAAPALEKAVAELPGGVSTLIMDMTELAYISSAGLRVLLTAQNKMSERGALRLTGVGEAVMEVLEMTGFAGIMEIV